LQQVAWRAASRYEPRPLMEHDLIGKPVSTFPDHALDISLEHDLFRKPASTPDHVRGRLFRDHALTAQNSALKRCDPNLLPPARGTCNARPDSAGKGVTR
jgi:hypothetical protein